jgi:hypothetical protein
MKKQIHVSWYPSQDLKTVRSKSESCPPCFMEIGLILAYGQCYS